MSMSLEYQREWRAKNRDKAREYQRKWARSAKGRQVLREREKRLIGTIESKARNMIRNRINRKKIPHPSFFLCTDCNKHAKHYHHEDYSLWWSVEPLCHSCHGKRHRKTWFLRWGFNTSPQDSLSCVSFAFYYHVVHFQVPEEQPRCLSRKFSWWSCWVAQN